MTKAWTKWTKQHDVAVRELLKDNPSLTSAQISNRLKLPHAESTVCMALKRLTEAGKVHRERNDKGGFFYFPAVLKPPYKTPEHKVEPPAPVNGSADVLIVVPVGSNKTATLTLAEARRVYDQLASLFN
jgi:DNA-binding transcriptional ArsR family regulator